MITLRKYQFHTSRINGNFTCWIYYQQLEVLILNTTRPLNKSQLLQGNLKCIWKKEEKNPKNKMNLNFALISDFWITCCIRGNSAVNTEVSLVQLAVSMAGLIWEIKVEWVCLLSQVGHKAKRHGALLTAAWASSQREQHALGPDSGWGCGVYWLGGLRQELNGRSPHLQACQHPLKQFSLQTPEEQCTSKLNVSKPIWWTSPSTRRKKVLNLKQKLVEWLNQ